MSHSIISRELFRAPPNANNKSKQKVHDLHATFTAPNRCPTAAIATAESIRNRSVVAAFVCSTSQLKPKKEYRSRDGHHACNRRHDALRGPKARHQWTSEEGQSFHPEELHGELCPVHSGCEWCGADRFHAGGRR
uniref:(northern house mosquito) hypothetical protein n=1 Tax=Culex pipiens TaxID=7175 RepID=A0A8D8AEU7_CULPI